MAFLPSSSQRLDEELPPGNSSPTFAQEEKEGGAGAVIENLSLK